MVYSHIAHELKTLPKTLSYVAVEKTICMHIAMATLYSDLVGSACAPVHSGVSGSAKPLCWLFSYSPLLP